MHDEQPPGLQQLSIDQIRAQQAISARRVHKLQRATKFALYKPLDHQRAWFETDRPISVLALPNQSGKTTAGGIITLSASLGTRPIALGGTVQPKWPRGTMAGKRFLAAGASYEKITKETIWPKLQEYLSDDMVLHVQKTGGYVTSVTFVTGAVLALRSYDQNPKKFEGGNYDGAWFDEPPPREIFNATRRGQMATQGWCLITGTPLAGDSWMRDEVIAPSQDLDCDECSGGDVPHAELVAQNPAHGRVYVPDPIEMHDNCRECCGGYLPHAEIEAFLASITDETERAARQHGIYIDSASLTFGYVNDKDNVVEDFDPPVAWPLVEIVDPAPKRGLHIKWYTVDENDRWYNTHAERIPSDGGFRQMVKSIFVHRARIAPGRAPDLCLMDPRGGAHRMVSSEGTVDWFEGFRQNGIDYTPAHAPSTEGHSNVQTLHDWLKSTYDPSKGTDAAPKLRFCRRLRVMKKGPLWAYERFTWDPLKSPRKQWEQEAKDFIDCDTYLALWVNKHHLTFKKMQSQDRPQRPGLAASYASGPRGQRQQPQQRSPQQRASIGRSYRSAPEWMSRVRGNYS